MKYTLVIPAAGKGKRMGAGINKLLIPMQSAPVIIHTLRAFENDSNCAEIILVISEDEYETFSDLLAKYDIKKDVVFVNGGSERQDSVYNGICHAQHEYVLVHDGARPFVTEGVTQRVLDAAVEYGASICAVPVKDTIKRIVDGVVEETVERSALWAVQTPQGFHLPLLKKAHQIAREAGYNGTDDASLVEYIKHKVTVVEGSYYNIKVTTPDDLVVAEAFLRTNR
ncbi:2-C-methyl-D-erythritol 4-phosphate cytidylyltransferase [Ectobacillus antri]|jgi:2-C-methyl-D-erythritol 4-phosphate cytidylyltransferase|uniref:2-C-methyl-D-erythritol 4-phosphate cytidylyltransferase n=1 Tax=Ectobacillus antri TaxID=2486280 RepID=A0ABT6H6E2_9BACI|nr:2-C-methyl-D-erythritol 4-phosphate cytidylyltransferase [Ectobacillus antri]MDG4657840.1 2-C-methyl-D-erythritol 4-phosphate cytidylyltransferase [Ectobacillus antri]MDG5754907.1 2-C-methyl-D-erythritol 4-phosphate cytidylyltransferase [Ectobacillus antri]